MAEAPDFYAALGERLSQGDVVDGVPWGLIDDPVQVCQPADRSKIQGKATYGPLAPHHAGGQHAIHAKAQVGLVMVLWQDCQIEKFENQGKPPEKWFAAVAPLHRLPEGTAGENIARGARRAFFPVPAYPAIGIATNGYVDLRHIWPVKQSLLVKRVGTLSIPSRNALYGHLFTFLTQRSIATNLHCPSCSAALSQDLVFPSLAEEAVG